MAVLEAYRGLARAQKGHARGAPAYSVYLNRRLGRVLAAIGYSLGLTPNQVSIISAVHSFVAIGLIAFGPHNVLTGVLVAILLAFGYAWDSADGQVARLRGGGSPQGEWLDHFIDTIKISSLHIAVVIGLYRVLEPDDAWLLLIPLLFTITEAAKFTGTLLNDMIKGKNDVVSTHQRGGGTLARSLILLPTDYGLICLSFALWGWTSLFMVVYSAFALVSAVFLALAAVKWFREMGTIGALK